jgi:HSP20 family protein
MTLVRWDPFNELLRMQRRFNRSFCDENDSVSTWAPAVDIFEKGDDLIIRAEIPGVGKDDIDINVENNNLRIRGERKRDEEFKQETAYRMERTYGSFVRTFSLPRTVDSSRISASYNNGVLELTIPKAEEAKPKKIEIQAA